jgi:hypothetical protein
MLNPDQASKPVLSYAPTPRAGRFKWLAFCAGFFSPYAYAPIALALTGGFENFYNFGLEVKVAIGMFPVLVWVVQIRWKQRGFLAGVIAGTLVLPALIVLALFIAGAP